jgi:NitT/TauT family transport system substrate-binding protein
VAEELLRAEGFTDVQYVKVKKVKDADKLLNSGQLDLAMGFSARRIRYVVPGDPTVFLSGLHAGCFSLLGSDRVRSIRDLKGKTVALTGLGSGRHIFFVSMVSYVGLDPSKDFKLVTGPKARSLRLFTEGKVDAFMAFAPEPQELLAKKIGRVLVDTNVDRPWSQYFCCMVVGNREFIRRNPVASPTASGESTTPRTQSASTLCACVKSG